MSNDTCSTEDCTKATHRAGMCGMHYQREWRARPKLNLSPQAKLEARFWAKVEKGAGCWEWTGSKCKGHGHLGVEGRTVYAHRFSYELLVGPIPEGLVIDHMCHNKACVNPGHLRAVTTKQNNEHRSGPNPNNKSGVHGVHWRPDNKKWQVTIQAGPRRHHVGYFEDLAEAGAAAAAKRNELFTHNDNDRRAA